MRILVNNMEFDVYFVPSGCECLRDSDGIEHLGMTDILERIICVRNDLDYETTKNVLQHEMSHCISYAFGYPVDYITDEILAGFSGEYADEIYQYSDEILRKYWN